MLHHSIASAIPFRSSHIVNGRSHTGGMLACAGLLQALCTLAFSLPAQAITAIPSWEAPELIFEQDSMDGKMTGQDRFLDVDNFGSPGVAIPARPGGAGAGFWQKLPGATWNFGFAEGAASAFSSFAFDRSEQPVITNIAINGPNLRVARPSLFGFDTEIPSLSPAGAGNTSLAIDPLGRTGIAYVDELDNLKYVIDVDGNGAFDDDNGDPAVASLANQMQRPSLAFDPQAHPMVAFINGFTGTLNYDVAQFGINFGGRVEPDPALPMVDFVSLAVNPLTRFPAIAYNDRENGLLKYTYFDGADWNVDVVHTQPGGDASDMSVSLAFDPADGRPAIAFTGDTDTNRNVLQFAWFDGGDWNLQTVDNRANIAVEAVSLAFHEDFGTGFGDGVPAIAYISDTGQVHYIEDPILAAPSADVDQDGDVDGADILTWQLGFGIEGDATLGDGDVNLDGNVDGDDLLLIQNGMSDGGTGSVTAVPEPSAALLALLSLGLFVMRSRG